jgi:hypothetical protein
VKGRPEAALELERESRQIRGGSRLSSMNLSIELKAVGVLLTAPHSSALISELTNCCNQPETEW